MSLGLSAHRRLGVSAVLLLGLAGAVVAAPSAPPQVPPLMDPASHEHHTGKVVWMELVTPDLAGAERFYGGLFGWTFEDVPGARVPYALALSNDYPVASFVQPRAPHGGKRQPAWVPFMATRDITAVKNTAVAHGGRVLSAPGSYPDRGMQAVFADPQGAVFGALQSASGDPPDELGEPGEWIWASLLTSDPKRAATFYQTVFGYDAQPLPGQGEDEGSHWLLSSDGFARASANLLPVGAQKDMPYWLPFVRVQNVAASVAKVTNLGGSVVTPPHRDRDGAMLAVIADPAGTPFGVMEWVEEASAAPGAEEHPR